MFSLKKSPNDSRDWKFTTTSPELPEKLDLRDELMPVREQGPQGTCAAQTAACMKEYQERMESGFDEYMSPQFIYNNRPYWNNEVQDGEDENEDYGMTCRNIMKILSKIGVCPEKMYPYGIIEYAREIKDEVKEEAKKNCIQGYAQIETIDELKNSLYENGPCMIAFPVYHMGEDMWNSRGGEFLGGHAMTIVGYDEIGFIIRNSWSETWGKKGYCTYPYNDWGAHWEIWTTIDKTATPPPFAPPFAPPCTPSPPPIPPPRPPSPIHGSENCPCCIS